jgi:hypothetical protein
MASSSDSEVSKDSPAITPSRSSSSDKKHTKKRDLKKIQKSVNKCFDLKYFRINERNSDYYTCVAANDTLKEIN